MKKTLKQYWILLVTVPVILILDQVSKAIVRANIPFGSVWMPWEWLRPVLKFVYWHNTGAAFGLFQDGGTVFAIMAVAVSIFIIVYFKHVPQHETLTRVALSMQMAGALGNLIDRLAFGPVTDFISVGTFAVFNIADSSITVGTALLILSLWLEERKERKAQMDAAPEAIQDPESQDKPA
ncbi:MAG: signal peptidase II [Anaerolineaceae bacterium]|nr:signal peptidase II [Anaerolineaceae bacterium]